VTGNAHDYTFGALADKNDIVIPSRVCLGFLPRYMSSLSSSPLDTLADSMVTQDPLPTGRSPGSAWWAGLTNLYYTCVRSLHIDLPRHVV
jgi:hypothetical protein